MLEDSNVLIDVTPMLRVGDSLVPWNLMSDGTHLSNFAGNKEKWPVYMTIANQASKIHKMP